MPYPSLTLGTVQNGMLYTYQERNNTIVILKEDTA